MGNEEKVSIIIPACNAEKSIGYSVESALNQKYKNIEVLIVVNNCKDNTESVCNKIANTEKRVVVLKSEKKGIVCARKRGVEEASGEYITFLDADDAFVDNNVIGKMVLLHEKSKSQITQFGYKVKYKRIPFLFNRHKIKSDLIIEKQNLQDLYLRGLYSTSYELIPSVWAKIYNSDVIKSAFLNLDVEVCYAEDMLINSFALTEKNVRSVSVYRFCSYIYKVGGGVMSNGDAGVKLLNDYKIVKPLIEKRLKEANVSDEVLKVFYQESLGCFQAVFSDIYGETENIEKCNEIFNDIENSDYFISAKQYINNYEHKDEYYSFLSSNYSFDEYLNEAKKIVQDRKNNIKNKLKTSVKKVLFR